MLNVRKYLPSTESYDSLPDTLATDISTDGENTYVAGIPEELIKPAEKTEQDEEEAGAISNMVHKQKEAQDIKEKFEESEEKKFDEEHPDDESTEVDVGGDADESQGETDESVDSTQVEDEPEETPVDKDPEEDEEEDPSIQYAIEAYSKLLTNAGDNLSHQSVEMLNVGLSRLHKKLAVEMVSTEAFETGPKAVRMTTSADSFLKQLQLLKESLGSTTNL